jgi:hypothetical protein
MRTSLDDLNRVADKLLETEGDLDARVSLASEVRRPDFAARVAGPAGAFLATASSRVRRRRLSDRARGGPKAFFTAYDKARRRRAAR